MGSYKPLEALWLGFAGTLVLLPNGRRCGNWAWLTSFSASTPKVEGPEDGPWGLLGR